MDVMSIQMLVLKEVKSRDDITEMYNYSCSSDSSGGSIIIIS